MKMYQFKLWCGVKGHPIVHLIVRANDPMDAMKKGIAFINKTYKIQLNVDDYVEDKSIRSIREFRFHPKGDEFDKIIWVIELPDDQELSVVSTDLPLNEEWEQILIGGKLK